MKLLNKIRLAKQRRKFGYTTNDAVSINEWFINLMPKILNTYKQLYLGHDQSMSKYEWLCTVDDMIEAFSKGSFKNKVNKYADAYSAAYIEFVKKYGVNGKKLRTNDEILSGKYVIHYMQDVPEYKEIALKYAEEELRLNKEIMYYRNKALNLFVKHFEEL